MLLLVVLLDDALCIIPKSNKERSTTPTIAAAPTTIRATATIRAEI